MTEVDLNSRLDEAWSGAEPLDSALRIVLEHFGAASGTIHFLAPDGLLHLKAHGPGMPPPVLEKIRRIPPGKGMAGLAFERAEPVSTCNLQEDTTGDVRPGAKATGLRGSVVVPILVSGRPVGTLGVGHLDDREFKPEEIDKLLAVGRRIAQKSELR